MFVRVFMASVFTLGLSGLSFAQCAPCGNVSDAQNAAYSSRTERGVTVMRGNMPTLGNVRAGQLQDRRADTRRYERARVRAVHAQRRADNARVELARERRENADYGRYNTRYYPRRAYLISSPSYYGHYGYRGQGYRGRGYGHHSYGNRGVSNAGVARATFTRRIRN